MPSSAPRAPLPPSFCSGPELTRSYSCCVTLARREAGNFYHAFRLLPADQHRALCALYSFLRISDDLADSSEPVLSRCQALQRWGQQLEGALAGTPTHPIHLALRDTVDRYGIPKRYLTEVLAGVAMDLETTHYDTFTALYRYCYHVASAVGLACIHIWGCKDEAARTHAEAAGIAFQLTNILRDLKEDAERGRVYLPQEDLRRFNYDPENLRRGVRDASFRALMAFEAERAYRYYQQGEPLAPLLPAPGRAVFLAMLRTYRALLDRIVASDFDVFNRRIRVGRLYKLWLALRVLPVRWGWSTS
jgi:phytoene synthase